MNKAQPVFPVGMIKKYKSKESLIDYIDVDKYVTKQYKNDTKMRSAKFNNILLELDPILKFCEESGHDFLANVLGLNYDEFWVSESWLNYSEKGGKQNLHNHSNSIISGVLYLKSEDGHPPLILKRQRQEFEPYISLTDHCKDSNGYMSRYLEFPCEENSMYIFSSNLYHMHDINNLDTPRVSLAWNSLVNFASTDESLQRLSFHRSAYTRPIVYERKNDD